jgi:hypothetical protein
MEKLVKILMSFLETRWMIKSTPFLLVQMHTFHPLFHPRSRHHEYVTQREVHFVVVEFYKKKYII